jgi:hypothetical protein
MTANEEIARANMADFVRAFFGSGNPVAVIEKLAPAQTAALGEVTVEEFMDGRGVLPRQKALVLISNSLAWAGSQPPRYCSSLTCSSHSTTLPSTARAPGSNVTLAPLTRAGSGALNNGSIRTVPMNHSAGPLPDGCEPFRMMSMTEILRHKSRLRKVTEARAGIDSSLGPRQALPTEFLAERLCILHPGKAEDDEAEILAAEEVGQQRSEHWRGRLAFQSFRPIRTWITSAWIVVGLSPRTRPRPYASRRKATPAAARSQSNLTEGSL